MDDLTEKSQIVAYMSRGASAREAFARVPMRVKRSASWAQKLFCRYKKYGSKALFDGRWQRTTEVRVMTPEVKKLVDFFLLDIPAAGPTAIWKEVCKECKVRGYTEPSCSSVKQYIASLPKPVLLLRKGRRGLRQWDRDGRPVVRFENTSYANERWQADDCPMPIWVRCKVNGVWVPAHASMTDSIDAHSRAIPGFIVSTRNPDAWSVKLLLRKAILPKTNSSWPIMGIPSVFQTDRHKNYISKETRAVAARLGIEPDPDPPYYPNEKGKIERFHRTLNEGCLKRLPGHMDAVGTTIEAAAKRVLEFLTIDQLRKEIERWITEEYHQAVHSETGRKPVELWEETVRLRMPREDEDALNLLLLHSIEPRTIRNVGIDFAYDDVRHTYWAPELMPFWGRKVLLRFNPDDMASVHVYCATGGDFICEAWDLRAGDPHYTVQDIKRNRSQFRMGLTQRLKEHFSQIENDDRPLKAREMFSRIREEQASKANKRETEPNSPQAKDDVDYDPDLLASFKAQRRGELVLLSRGVCKEEGGI
ncbi:MAG: Mu transposase C-terminal domain-containing protein [Acidobacteria bacterium]|nr:Mu transposase C-terminal domain-containing protein [Acidobacteriota bacterium]